MGTGTRGAESGCGSPSVDDDEIRRRYRMSRKPRCSSKKVAFRSEGAARRALERIDRTEAQAVAPAPSRPTRAYRCPECGMWHLSTR